MADASKTVLEWTFEPKDFFEEKTTLGCADGVIEISEGKVRGEFEGVHFAEREAFSKSTHAFLEYAFLAQQALVHVPYSLTQPVLTRVHADGRRDVSISVNSAVMVMSVGSVDMIVRDPSGNVISDSKATRLKEQAQFRSDVDRILPSDPALKRMLLSFRSALMDLDDLLVHLYEIREALITEFLNENAARKALGVSKADWSKFGRLANAEPVFEGRHRGKHSAHRNLTPDEATWARDFCQRLIEGYVNARK